MFFFFSKIFYYFLTPVFWISICLLLHFIIKKKILKKIMLIASFSILVIFSNRAIFQYVSEKWEIKSLPAESVTKKYDYAIVLGGMAMENDKTRKLYVSQSIDRLLQAINLYHNKKVDKIVITGGSGLLMTQEKKESLVLENFCKQFKVDERDIIIEYQSRNTHENATYTKEKVGTSNSCILITSGYHMRRSMGCFRKEGFSYDVLATDPLGLPFLEVDDYIIPKAEPLLNWNFIIKEWVGMLAYKIAGYI